VVLRPPSQLVVDRLDNAPTFSLVHAQAFERFGDPSIPVEEAAEKLMRAGQSNAVKKEVAGKDTLPTDGVKGSGVTANSMASAVQARPRQKAPRPALSRLSAPRPR
jgi:hypothetical protein